LVCDPNQQKSAFTADDAYSSGMGLMSWRERNCL
jgi:hypothetical protein